MDSLDALNLAAPIADTYNELEAMLLSHIAEQLAANPDTLINATSEWRIKLLAQMGRVNKETAKIIAAKTGKVPAEVEKVVEQAINKVLVENAVSGNTVSTHIENAMKSFDRQAVINKYNQVNTVMQYKAKQAFVNGVNSVADRFERKRQSEIADKQEYLDVLNKNALAVTVGEKSRTEAIRETIGQMCDKGIPAFVDASGRQWSPEAYVNMDIRNTAKNSALAAQWSVMDELEQDVILISSHSGARPKCAPYQGKLYSRSGKSGTIKDARGKEYTYEPLSSTSFGEPDGIFGINCGHRPRGVTEGMFISHEEIYSEKENSEEYERICEQRRQERKIRADKNKRDALKAAGDNEGAKELGRKITAENKELKAYCEREGLSYREDRTSAYGSINSPEKHYLKGGYSIKFNKVSGAKEITENLAKELSDQHNKAAKLFGLDKLSKMKSVNIANYQNDNVFGYYTPNSEAVTIFGAGGKDGRAFMDSVAKSMKKKGVWSTNSPLHAYRHELAHAIQEELAETDIKYAEKLKKLSDYRNDILKSLTNLPDDDIIKEKAQLLSTYGIDSKGEIDDFISEGIAEYLNGKPRETARHIVDILRGKD